MILPEKEPFLFSCLFPPLPSFFLRQCKFLEVDLGSGKQAASGLESTSPLRLPQPQKQEDLTMWNSPLVSTASGGMLFLPSYFFPHTCPAHLGNLFLLLLLFSPPYPSNCSKHLYICLFLSPTLLPLCLLVTPLLSLLHSHSRALQMSRLTSFSSQFSSVQFSRSVVSDFLQTQESQHTRPPCSSPSPGVHSGSCPSSP